MYYTYYSYESKPNGRGYIGYHKIEENKNPNNDGYFGSYTDPTFDPDKKIILQIFLSKKEAIKHETYLHKKYDVKNNSFFSNRMNQSSMDFIPPDIPWNKGKTMNKTSIEKRKQTIISKYGDKAFSNIMNKSWETIKAEKTQEEILAFTAPGREAAKKKGPWNKGLKGAQVAWNKGMSGERFSQASKKGAETKRKNSMNDNQQPS